MKPSLLVIGTSPTMQSDLQAIPGGLDSYDVCAVNRAGVLLPNISLALWATCHFDVMLSEQWEGQRTARGGESGYSVVSTICALGADLYFPRPRPSGGSALLAVLAGLSLGYRRVLLAGVSLTGGNYDVLRHGWAAAALQLAGRVQAVSGWPKGFLERLDAKKE